MMNMAAKGLLCCCLITFAVQIAAENGSPVAGSLFNSPSGLVLPLSRIGDRGSFWPRYSPKYPPTKGPSQYNQTIALSRRVSSVKRPFSLWVSTDPQDSGQEEKILKPRPKGESSEAKFIRPYGLPLRWGR